MSVAEKLGSGSVVTVMRQTAGSFDLRIELGGRTYFRAVAGESPAALTAALAETIAASIPR